MTYDKLYSRRANPQREQARADQVENSEGGYVFELDKWGRLERFLVLGSDGGTFYASPREVTHENAMVVEACLAEDPARVLATILTISEAGRAPRNDPAIFALALACCGDHLQTKDLRAALPRIARTGTHLLTLVAILENLRGWGRKARRAVASWYEEKDAPHLAYQVAKYPQRGGWSHRDVLRLCHPEGLESALAERICGREAELPATCRILEGRQRAQGAAEDEIPGLVRDYGLTWEMLPTAALRSPAVWEALLERIPYGALLRNLGRLGSIGTLEPMSDAERVVLERLSSEEHLRASRVHPIAVLKALRTYARGGGIRGSMSWTACPRVVDALDDAFHASFGNVEAAGKRTLLGIDVSGSMSWHSSCAGGTLTSAECAAAMAMVTYRTEPQSYARGFAKTFRDLGITPRMTLSEVLDRTSLQNFGSTDCALPMLWAEKQGVRVDTFVVYTDNETYAGDIHPHQALERYRQKTGIPAKLVVVGTESNGFTIADPTDPGMLDVVGFDVAAPQAITEFSR